jgi:uncharacterized protein (DUF1684 family)
MCHETTMFMTRLICAALVCVCAACSGQRWPDPPAIDQAQYQKNYAEWLDGQQTTARDSSMTFRIGEQEQKLTAFLFPDSEELFVLFKDATNASTTYGYRIVRAAKVAAGEWTTIDFNVASNPPCAYSPFTTCPLPPAENRLAVAIEAGEKRFPTGRGFEQP